MVSTSFCLPQVLDAPALQDDFYLNLVDWSAQNVLAVGLGERHCWSPCRASLQDSSSSDRCHMQHSCPSAARDAVAKGVELGRESRRHA
jgi:hypothetical protein